jgi:Uma2 family endonuclease
MSVFPVRHSVSVDEFERMVEAGVFAPDERLELIDGEILDMSPIGDPHQGCVNRLTALFARLAADDRAVLQVQGAFQAGDWSMPQPDVALLRPRTDFYASGRPQPSDLLLAVEVADSSLRYDRGTKRSLYARVGVPEMWMVDLNGGAVDVACEPSDGAYRRIAQARSGDTIAPAAFPDVTLAVAQLFGRPPSTPV